MTITHQPSRMLRFRARQANTLWGAGARYFWLESAGAPVMANAKCPHRGGPLHLGTLSADGTQILCPMHQLPTRVATLRRGALPMVLRSDEVVVMVPQEEGELLPFHSCNGRKPQKPQAPRAAQYDEASHANSSGVEGTAARDA